MADRIFLREVNLDMIDKTLLFYQNSVGNVSAVVWDASLVLSKYLNKRSKKSEDWLRDMKVLELGSGLGCAGITAACFGADVILTDLPDVVPQLAKTIELNRIPISEGRGKAVAMELKWGSSVQIQPILDKWNGPPNIILAADCIYYEESLKPLADTIKNLSGLRTEIIISQEIRETGRQQYFLDGFMEYLMADFDLREVHESDQDEVYQSEDIHLYTALKKYTY
uniref:Methyltransferase-like protein 21D n=1 Tax=Lygus hesperus TaxID=30085 RepID=A0A146LL62_LYGHE